MMTHCSFDEFGSVFGTASAKYEITARHSASMLGRPNAGPQTCSSSAIGQRYNALRVGSHDVEEEKM